MLIYTACDRTPFTYLIGWTKHNKWYYGVRYAKGCLPTDIMSSYYTSSKIVHKFILDYGYPDIIMIRKIFDSVERAKLWEVKVLTRMNVIADKRFLNIHNSKSPPRLSGNLNPAKRIEVRQKLSDHAKKRVYDENFKSKISQTKIKQNIISFFKNRCQDNITGKHNITRLKKYVDFLNSQEKTYTRIIKTLELVIMRLSSAPRKPYPQNSKRGPRGKVPKISEAKLGGKYYYNPTTLECKIFHKDCEVPSGWIRGLIKNTPNTNTPEVRKKISNAIKKSRSNESDEKKQERLRKFHNTINKRKKLI